MTATDTPARLYVGTYAKYNAGSIQGDWLDLGDYSNREEFLEACAELHSDESDPEFMFQDFEGFPRAWYSESSAPPDMLWEAWLDLDDEDRTAFKIYLGLGLGDESAEDFRDRFRGAWNSGADFAEDQANESGAVPSDFPSWICIDWEGTWERGLRFDYSYEEKDGKVFIFDNH